MKNKKLSPTLIVITVIVVLSILAGVVQIAAAGAQASRLNEGAAVVNSGGADVSHPSDIVEFVTSTSPAARVVVGTVSVLAGLAIFGYVTRKPKASKPEEGE